MIRPPQALTVPGRASGEKGELQERAGGTLDPSGTPVRIRFVSSSAVRDRLRNLLRLLDGDAVAKIDGQRVCGFLQLDVRAIAPCSGMNTRLQYVLGRPSLYGLMDLTWIKVGCQWRDYSHFRPYSPTAVQHGH